MSGKAILVLVLAVASTAFPLAGQNVNEEFWPQMNVFLNWGTRFRFVFSDLTNRDLTTGGSRGYFSYFFDVALKPLFRRDLRDREDVFRARFLTFRAGYRYGTPLVNNNSNSGSENRILAETIARYPLPAKFVLADRSRGEFRFIQRKPFSMRYRNRLNLERDITLGSLVLTPYAYDEIFYDTASGSWNQNRYAFGLQIPTGRHVVLEPYYLRKTTRGTTPALVNVAGFTLNLYF
jgi:hypothetical protein